MMIPPDFALPFMKKPTKRPLQSSWRHHACSNHRLGTFWKGALTHTLR